MPPRLNKSKNNGRSLQIPTCGPKRGTLDRLEGTRGAKAKTFGVQVELYIAANPSIFPKNRSKIIFVILYLIGAAGSWAILFTNRALANNLADPVMYNDFQTA
ncbi:uncharacterized protein VP01_3692g1 [Puccinia sorghi]|uniref:Uncharacterized protein n=1 Tax=Puccinia sorghi TaxID=27349 RepID=A0A0L6UV11_9BASI|nr:uncharacterized protein VP01_3692g1 [Puccinia sorghi]